MVTCKTGVGCGLTACTASCVGCGFVCSWLTCALVCWLTGWLCAACWLAGTLGSCSLDGSFTCEDGSDFAGWAGNWNASFLSVGVGKV